MNNKLEFDSEFCHVIYMERDNVVFLTWKKFARLDDYREPAIFALNLLNKYPNSNFVVDARNGFEDDKEDVKWGFSVLLPNMAKTDCKYVVFIMQQASDIDDEMDMWTKEFKNYFVVYKVESYEQAIHKINNRLLVNVSYIIKPGKRDEFLEKVREQQIIKASKAEPGNIKYEYYIPADTDNVLFLMEIWANREVQELHGKTEHYKRLQLLKQEYVTHVNITNFMLMYGQINYIDLVTIDLYRYR